MVQLSYNNFEKIENMKPLRKLNQLRGMQIHRIQKFQTEPIYTKKYEQIFPIQNYFALD